MDYNWEYIYTITDKSNQRIVQSAIRYAQAPTEEKIKEKISRDIRTELTLKTSGTRWNTLKQHQNTIYCRKETKNFSILAKIKLIQNKEKPCSTPMMLECNAS